MWSKTLFFITLIFVLALIGGCATSGDDDDNQPSDDDMTDDDSADDDSGDDTAGDDTADDDTADDDAADDDTADDDSAPQGKPPVILSVNFYMWPLEFPNATNELTGSKKFDPEFEGAGIYMEYNDPDCDLVGGKIWAILDGADPVVVKTLPPNVNCSSNQSGFMMGFDLKNQFKAAGSHKVEIYWTDAANNESKHKNVYYTVGPYDHSIGTVMDDWTLLDQNGNEVTLADILASKDKAASCVWLEVLTGSCPYCNQEASELEPIYTDHQADGLRIVGIMVANASGNAPEAADLQDWITSHSITYVVVGDPNAAVTNPYFVNNYVPFNIALDGTGLIRSKMTGWSNFDATQIIESILGAE